MTAYVDYSDPRFLRLHSTTRSDYLDDPVRGWTARLPELDHGWFDDGFLDQCSKLGEFRAIGIDYTNAPLTAAVEDDGEIDDLDPAYQSIRLRQTGRPRDLL